MLHSALHSALYSSLFDCESLKTTCHSQRKQQKKKKKKTIYDTMTRYQFSLAVIVYFTGHSLKFLAMGFNFNMFVWSRTTTDKQISKRIICFKKKYTHTYELL